MNNVVDLPRKDEVYDQASHWIAKLDRKLSRDEEKDLKNWLQQSPLHRGVLFEMASLWDRMDSFSRLASLFPPPEKSKRSYNFYTSMAACLVIVMFSGFFALAMVSPNTFPSWLAPWQMKMLDGRYETGVGEHSTVNLPDGSQVVLNTNSLIKVKYSSDARRFHLERGEVHISVAHDNSRPLSVIAGDKVVQAVGTAFNVQIFNEREVELIVTDGQVRVADRDKNQGFEKVRQAVLPNTSLAVSKGEKIVLGAKDAVVKKIETHDIEANLSWREGNLVFRGETLEQALQEISRYTDIEFDIADNDIKELRIAGMFKAGDVKGLLTTLEKNFSIDHEQVQMNKVLLKAL